ncbi:hypothetical protein GWI33_019695 [Rhynchophorus ferrugineus]|uniref:Uncharacterized protein n=1 Tax=Rhynchophorus ferrugineus TaxID=354439 RepID=A0A834HTY3_RHYFE|nr:hypothetical protein GWI33_019695 [Rhynchophorus ferrugineus]
MRRLKVLIDNFCVFIDFQSKSNITDCTDLTVVERSAGHSLPLVEQTVATDNKRVIFGISHNFSRGTSKSDQRCSAGGQKKPKKAEEAEEDDRSTSYISIGTKTTARCRECMRTYEGAGRLPERKRAFLKSLGEYRENGGYSGRRELVLIEAIRRN